MTTAKAEKQIRKAIQSGEACGKLGNVLPDAKVKYIDETTMRWVTVAICIDSPRRVGEAVAKARKQHKGKTLWVWHVYGREIAK